MPSESKGYGAFYVVGTPIGNLADISARAKETLIAADTVFCEDTRVGSKLFNALGISPMPKFLRCDAHTGEREISAYVDEIREGVQEGRNFALISDAEDRENKAYPSSNSPCERGMSSRAELRPRIGGV